MMAETLRNEVQKLLDEPLADMQRVSGGSINQAAKITTEKGKSFFLKWNSSAASDMFPKEEMGLQELKSAESGLRIPEVIGTGTTVDGTDFILMEYITEGSADSQSPRRFGERLAALHRVTANQFGLDHDNYIGPLAQSNTRHDSWIEFFVRERLQAQLRMAVGDGKLSPGIRDNFERLYKQLPNILADEPASLLHGDLWSGNYFFDVNGQPVIYDPAVYYGNREIELAMTHLFGGFSAAFYEAYKQAFPLQPGFSSRKHIYNLYPLLVHTNLFGASYARRVQSIVNRY